MSWKVELTVLLNPEKYLKVACNMLLNLLLLMFPPVTYLLQRAHKPEYSILASKSLKKYIHVLGSVLTCFNRKIQWSLETGRKALMVKNV